VRPLEYYNEWLSGNLGSGLDDDQLVAFFVIGTHLYENKGKSVIDTAPLRMIISGPGGTGKSEIINHVTRYSHVIGMKHAVIVLAMYGSAAYLVGGQTFHSGVPRFGKDSAVSMDEKDAWLGVLVVLIDEYGTVGQNSLEKLNNSLKKVSGLQVRKKLWPRVIIDRPESCGGIGIRGWRREYELTGHMIWW